MHGPSISTAWTRGPWTWNGSPAWCYQRLHRLLIMKPWIRRRHCLLKKTINLGCLGCYSLHGLPRSLHLPSWSILVTYHLGQYLDYSPSRAQTTMQDLVDRNPHLKGLPYKVINIWRVLHGLATTGRLLCVTARQLTSKTLNSWATSDVKVSLRDWRFTTTRIRSGILRTSNFPRGLLCSATPIANRWKFLASFNMSNYLPH
ncbi:hypothetical protein B0T26DRAFT_142530 [Lasiosphaeria miniovina]|uniref:Uncharacterized protein n=1 Tax=Lasiosphaeria miniovina TaxID=1954250 RepID=A0AA40E9U9_9PEZI|nr:uncharacterized protein B0T26DRAFT_142530 [Lasiosphaeria miniovina]KAK0727683.1 hypothetical protein B0T26DRAFT_142530 [Lasiosphaeria miniovina]